MRFLWGAIAIIAFCAACTRQQGSPANQPAAKNPWNIRALDFKGDTALFNGTLGVHILPGRADVRDETLMFRHGRLLVLKGPLGSVVTIDGQPLAAAGSFESEFHLRDGMFSCRWKQGGASIQVEWLVHPMQELLARRIEITADSATVRLRPAPRTQKEKLAWASDRDKAKDIPAVVLRHKVLVDGKEPAGEAEIAIQREGRTVVIEDLIAFDDEPAESFDTLAAEVANAWSERWKTEIEIDGPIEDQRAIRACLFQLYAGGNAKLPPFGTSNTRYGGHRFWDAEAWMLPVYALVQPEVARKATDWRARTASRRLPGWETGADGADITPPSHKSAIHIWGWVYWWFERAEALGLLSSSDEAERAKRRIEEAYLARAERSDRGLEFRGVLPPDEGRPRDNDLITNLLARFALSRRHPELASQVVLPRAHDGLLASWDGDHLRGYQQASALLALYPLEWRMPRHEAEAMFERYVDLTSPNGPAMSDSIHATIAARFASAAGEGSAEWSRRAYQLWRESWEPFLDPLGGFSERRKTRETSFLTGAAGCLQTVIYGFAGLRLVPPGTNTEGKPLIELNGGWRLAAQPALPPGWRSLTLRGIWLMGQRYTIRATQAGDVVIRES